MNAVQYDIVDRFLKISGNPQKLAKVFKIPITEVLKVQDSNNFKQYQSGDVSGLGDMFDNLFKGAI